MGISDSFNDILRRARLGEFLAIFAAPPCSTFSVSRYFVGDNSDDDGPPPVRSRAYPTVPLLPPLALFLLSTPPNPPAIRPRPSPPPPPVPSRPTSS